MARTDPRWPTLTPKMVAALDALLTTRSLQEASDACGVPVRTLNRWRAERRDFRDAYTALSRMRLAETAGRLRQVSAQAANVLQAAMDDDTNPAVRVRAAVAVLDVALKIEMDELAARVAALEEETPIPAASRYGRRGGQ